MTEDHGTHDDGFDENDDEDYEEVTRPRKPRKSKLKRENEDDDLSPAKRKKTSGGHKRKMCDFCEYSTHRYRGL